MTNMNTEKELRIEFKRYLLGQGIELVDLDEYAEKGIATWWLSKLSETTLGIEPRQVGGEYADAAEMLWVVLANVNGSDWSKQTSEWQEAAARWRDNYFAVFKSKHIKQEMLCCGGLGPMGKCGRGTRKDCDGLHCKCMNKDCTNMHYVDCYKHYIHVEHVAPLPPTKN